MMVQEYGQFLQKKQTALKAGGFQVDGVLHEDLKEFQRALTRLCLRRGRAALLANTGLGKTLMQLVWAHAVCDHTGGRVLILTPLAVAEQTIAEARKFNILDVGLARTNPDALITVSNYEQLHKFDPKDFVGIVLDESSILKHTDAKTRVELTEYFAHTPYRLCCSATPSPNDFTEIGNHAEFLGVCSYKEMLATYFVHDGGIRVENVGGDGWRLKRHAQNDFWHWVSSWACVVRHPKDIGFAEDGYDLPALRKHQVFVDSKEELPPGKLLAEPVTTLSARISARRSSVVDRAESAAKIVQTRPDEPWLIWCGLNAEADAVTRLLPDAEEVRGSDTTAAKTKALLGFCVGKPLMLVSKPRIAGFGMNWQHCSNMIFLGLNDSFEQVFQATRRCWRFGQTKPVDVWLVISRREGPVLKNLERKEREFETMVAALTSHTNVWLREQLEDELAPETPVMRATTIKLPAWL